MAESSLLNLPQELKDEIASYLQAPDLSRFSRSCVELFMAHTPSLYKHITVVAPVNEERDDGIVLSLPAPHAYSLSRTISSDPKKGRFIESLQLRNSSLGEDSLRTILTQTPNLSTLHLDYLLSEEGEVYMARGPTKLDGFEIQNKLAGVRNTLTNLKITFQVLFNTSYSYHPYLIVWKFSLKTLEIPLRIFFSNPYKEKDPDMSLLRPKEGKQYTLADILPQSLVRLKFERDCQLHPSFWVIQGFLKPMNSPWKLEIMFQILLDFFQHERWKQDIPELEDVSADLFGSQEEYERIRTGLSSEHLEALDKWEVLLKNLLVVNGLRCETFRLHPGLLRR